MASSDSVMDNISQELTDEDKRYAAEHLNESDETRENAVAEIRRWIEKELRVQIDDFLILRFLRVCKFNLEKTKIRLGNYYKLRSHLPEWFTNKDIFQPKMQELLDMGVFLPLRKPDSKGRLVIITRSTRPDPSRYEISDLVKVSLMVKEMAVKHYPAASIYGYAVYSDVANPTMRHILQYRPYALMNLVHLLHSCYPMRYQTVNLINCTVFFEIVVKIIKSFLTDKMKNRFSVYTHADQSCFKDVPAEILPIEYGGTGDTCQKLAEYWKKLIEENYDWLKRNDEDDRVE